MGALLYTLGKTLENKAEKTMQKSQEKNDFLNSMSIDELDGYLKKETAIKPESWSYKYLKNLTPAQRAELANSKPVPPWLIIMVLFSFLIPAVIGIVFILKSHILFGLFWLLIAFAAPLCFRK